MLTFRHVTHRTVPVRAGVCETQASALVKEKAAAAAAGRREADMESQVLTCGSCPDVEHFANDTMLYIQTNRVND